MDLATHIKPISYLKSQAADIVQDLSERREPLRITQNGEARLVVMDVHSDEAQTLALLKILALGQREIEQDHFRPAGDVFAEQEQGDARPCCASRNG
jgi:PHD/YefM family antitoxin component YafN of YafNO toxin-antitoxin module